MRWLNWRAGCRLALDVVDKPYRDEDGSTGYTTADKAQIACLAGLLGNYALGYVCWLLTGSTNDAGVEMVENLPPVEGFLATVRLLAVIPLP